MAATGRVRNLQVGDVDGDLVKDFVFIEENNAGGDSLGFSMGRKAGGPEVPIHVSGLGKIELTASGRAIEPNFHLDAATDIGVVTQKGGQRSAAVFYGSPQRFFVSPYEIQIGGSLAPASHGMVGDFDGKGHSDVAVLTLGTGASLGQVTDQTTRLWLLPSQGDAELSNSPKSTDLPKDALGCASLSLAANLDGQGADEVVVLAPAYEGGTTLSDRPRKRRHVRARPCCGALRRLRGFFVL